MKLSLLIAAFLVFGFSGARASHWAGGEITYQWLHDSTYKISYHFYRSCQGISEPATVDVCYYNTCSPSVFYALTLSKDLTLADGKPNGTVVSVECPVEKSACTSDSSVFPGYRDWLYSGNVTLYQRCDHWVFCYSAGHVGGFNNIAPSFTPYIEATLDNLDAQGNSSAYFSSPPVPYIIHGLAFNYDAAAIDPDRDSINFEVVNPLSDSNLASCYPTSAPVNYVGGISNPFSTSSFSFNKSTGQMLFIPNAIGQYDLAIRTNELRKISGIWKTVGQTMRNVFYNLLEPYPGTIPPLPPAVHVVGPSVTGATFDVSSGYIVALAGMPFKFDYLVTSSNPNAVISVTDNSFFLKDTVVYTNKFTDSVMGHFSWTPSHTDTGLVIFSVTGTDSTCSPVYYYPTWETTGIPIYIRPNPAFAGVEDQHPASALNIYPNPNDGGFTIHAALSDKSINTATIEIVNTIGRKLFQQIMGVYNGLISQQIHLPLSIPNGIYFLHITSAEQTYTARFILQR